MLNASLRCCSQLGGVRVVQVLGDVRRGMAEEAGVLQASLGRRGGPDPAGVGLRGGGST